MRWRYISTHPKELEQRCGDLSSIQKLYENVYCPDWIFSLGSIFRFVLIRSGPLDQRSAAGGSCRS